MFAKLKKKIVEEEGVAENDLKRSTSQTGQGRRESLRRAGESSTSLNSWGSTSSLSGASSTAAGAAGGPLTHRQNDARLENLQGEVAKKDEQLRKLESKLDEYSLLLKEAVRDKEKSQLQLDKHKEDAARRVQEINEEFQARRAKMAEKLNLAIKKKEDELEDKMTGLEKEKAELQEKLKKSEMQQFMKREDYDELQGFQVQELAKVKHMFVNTQEELHKCKADLEHATEQLEEKRRQLSSVEGDLYSAQSNLADVTKERDSLKKEQADQSNLLRKLSKEKAALEEAMNGISKEQEETSAQVVALQEKLDQREDAFSLLKHNSEILRNQAKKDIFDKESELGLLREKVTTLEQRLQVNDLSQDDHVKAVQSERDGMEQRLEETRRELSSVRVESNEKIASLEKQIEHLNAKIAEDTEEHRRSLQKAEATQGQLRAEVSDLQASLEGARKECSAHQHQAMQKEAQRKAQKEVSETELTLAHQQLTEVKQQFIESKKQLQGRVATLESKLVTAETARDFDKSASEHKLARLESINEEYLEKEIEHEKQVSCLEEELDKLRKSMSMVDSRTSHLQSELDSSRSRASELDAKAQELESLSSRQKEQLTILHATVKEKEQLIRKHETELQNLQQSVSELGQRLGEQEKTGRETQDEAQRLIFEKTETISVLQQSLEEKGEELTLITQKLQELQEKLVRVETEAQARIQESELNGHIELENQEKLRQSVESLEQQLADKNRTIKMQQQRLSDLKKTLQKELKVQTIAGYESPEEALRSADPLPNRSKLTVPENNFRGSNNSLQPPASSLELDSTLSRSDFREINFQYLRHVVFKFMSSTDYEAKQLLKAVSTVLELTPKEEALIKSTLDWKMSWFGARPAQKKFVQVGSAGSVIR
ncbi:golgin subfamily A member 1-like [Diadema antillarum]|uniref:golgin subfamily A member 1-like n=1 Tax=Diadema antillarum TaxID=105358 RepID=UPI003A87A4F5